MNIKTATVLIATVLSGCATNRPGQGVSESFAERWNCDYTEVAQDAELAKEYLSPGHVYVPETGWTACKVLARVGRPEDVDRTSYSGTREARWWYSKGQYDVRLVRLRLEDRGWVVRYVDW